MEVTVEAAIERAKRKFAEETAYDRALDSFCARTSEIEQERRKRLRALLATIDACPNREFTDEEILALAWEYYETPQDVRMMIETRPLRLTAWKKRDEFINEEMLCRLCSVSVNRKEWLRQFVAERFPTYGRRISRQWNGGVVERIVYTREEAMEIERAVREERGE